MRWTRYVCILALLAIVAGCLESSPAGRYAYFRWNLSQKSCNNGSCTYGVNAEEMESNVRCGPATLLSWDLQDWIHGGMSIWVYDGAGDQRDTRLLSRDGAGNHTLKGVEGTWHLEGRTSNANGNLEVRLTCL